MKAENHASVELGEPVVAELAINMEPRRSGEVAIGFTGTTAGFAWVPITEAREFAWEILRATRDVEDVA